MINSKVVKKLLISFFASIILLVSVFSRFATPTYAQLPDTWYAPEFGTFVDRVYDDSNPDEIFGERYSHAQVVWIFHSLSAIILPEFILVCMTTDSVVDVIKCLAGALDAIPGLGYAPHQDTDLAGTIDSVISKNPVSGVGYLRGLAEKFHIIPEAQAQGFGFVNLEPVRAIWAAVRDVSYFLLIFAFIIMAFMIMFRVKISPQTVITVQSALPRLVLILILITFSYAISGFVIDFAYLSLGLVAILGANLSGLDTLPLFQRLITSLPILTMFVIPTLLALAIVFGELSVPVLLGIILVFAAPLLTLLLFLVLLIIIIRILWLLVRTFINVILLIIASPILILLGVFPAAGGFGTWLRNLVSHVMVFPAIITLVFISHFIFWSTLGGGRIGDILKGLPQLNPYVINIGSSTGAIELPGFNLGDSTIFGAIVALGILFIIPSVGNIIQGMISGRPFGYGTAIGQAVGPATFVGRTAFFGGAGRAFTGAEEKAYGKGRPTPVWTQVGRRITGIRR